MLHLLIKDRKEINDKDALIIQLSQIMKIHICISYTIHTEEFDVLTNSEGTEHIS